MTNEIATTAPRLPMPNGFGDAGAWKVLTNAIFPNAKEPESIMMAVEYCRVRKLDIMKRPVNIVPVWNSELGRNVETFWPSITEVEITAARSEAWAGMDEPKFGPMITETIKGRRQDRKKGWIDDQVEITYPEFCSVTVYRMVRGQKCAFTEPVWWKEAYGRVAGGALPNSMWTKRPRGQLLKVAKAFSLRAAFPEEGNGPTAEEMEDQTIEGPPPAPAPTDNWKPPQEQQTEKPAKNITAEAMRDSPPPPQDQENDPGAGDADRINPDTGEVLELPHDIEHGNTEPWADWCARLLAYVREETELTVVEKWIETNKKTIEAMNKDAPKIHARLSAAIGAHRLKITQATQQGGL